MTDESKKLLKLLRTYHNGTYAKAIDEALALAAGVPTIEPEPRENTISRKAAIEAAINAADEWDGGMNPERARIIGKALLNLPSAQPEIIRCRDCKFFELDKAYIIQGIPVLGHECCNAWGDGCKTDPDGYCFLAERREG